MTYEINTILIHPSHGPVRIVGSAPKTLPNGETHHCLDLETLDVHTLALTIPVDRAVDSGLREVVSGDSLEELLATLREQSGEEPANWSRRYKANEEKMRSGSIIRLAEVVRDIIRRDADKKISLGEYRMLEKALSQLAREIFYAKGLASVDEAREHVRELVLAPA